jgi:hypothetical protein
MKGKTWIVLGITLAALGLLATVTVWARPGAPQAPLSTSFTYQGRLLNGGSVVSDTCAFAFSLWDAETLGAQAGITQTVSAVEVRDGYFTVQLNDSGQFGADAFTGDGRWLQVAVQCSGDADYATLGRQKLTAAPYAHYAQRSPWSGLTDVPAGFADGVDNTSIVVSGTNVFAGQGLNQLSAGNSITLSVAPPYRLPQTCADGQIVEWDDAGSVWVCGDDDAGGSGVGWSLTGNAGTDPAVNFLGTTDAVSLTLAVNGAPALRLSPTSGAPNLVGGDGSNSVPPGVTGATVSGGRDNQATASYAAIAGGQQNQAIALAAAIGGGNSNTASGDYATVGGGSSNDATGTYATVAGGGSNDVTADYATISGGTYNDASARYAFIGGGGGFPTGHDVTDEYGTVSGGQRNRAGDNAGTTTDATHATVGGGRNNVAGASYATVGGGQDNVITGTYATIGGGTENTASGYWAAIAGGYFNTASGAGAFIGGGEDNDASDEYTTVAGGFLNAASSSHANVGGGYHNTASGDYATVGGGRDNVASGDRAAVGGGYHNTAGGAGAFVGGGGYDGTTTGSNEALGDASTISGGYANDASDYAATVGGGYANTASGFRATIDGGSHNTASTDSATVGGGNHNTASGVFATIGGGSSSTASGFAATISGGWDNTASGFAATVSGGYTNTASGDYSFAAGCHAKANHDGCFVWGDSNYGDVTCDVDDAFIVRASGGITMYTDSGLSSGMYLSAGGSSWNAVSDRERKENFQPIDAQELLARLAGIPITTWNYKAQDPSIRHIGPMAQDFNTLVEGLGGEGEEYINTLDADGLALAAIQGLYAQNQALQAENAAQQAQIEALEARLAAFEAALAALQGGE